MKKSPKHYNKLTDAEADVLHNQATEPPFSGEYDSLFHNGLYICRQCDAPLYTSFAKFSSGCGWPSFDEEIQQAIVSRPDPDGRRIEIVCANCSGHLGHVFTGEQHTPKNTRHCVNSLAIRFVPIEDLFAQIQQNKINLGAALYAAGCFWGVEYHFARTAGVLATQVGYIGGQTENPSYEQVCAGNTGHAEALLVIFDNAVTDYHQLTKLFFNLHDPTQVDRQGPDIGTQYRSALFYLDDKQQQVANDLITQLKQQQLNVVTEVVPATHFWPAEEYHQQYYQAKGGQPYCHVLTERF